jgi:hypothetical protein
MLGKHEHCLRQLALTARLAALLLSVGGPARANALAEPPPFETSARVAEARLETLRGGMDFGNKVTLPFGIAVEYSQHTNGQETASFHLSNHGGKGPVEVSEHNMNVAVPIAPGTTVTSALNGSSILTLIQNSRPNLSLQTMQQLNITITGLKGVIQNSANTSQLIGRSFFH